jgi:hypothetical protein
MESSVKFKPKAGDTYNMELSVVPTVSQANDQSYKIWDFDMFDAPVSTIKAFQNKNHPVVCYFSGGSWENWRPDAKDFPKAALGKPLSGWPGEKWLDTRNPKVRAIMKKRILLAKSKGCDAVDVDNIDGYENPTGFDLTKADGISFVKFLAATAHAEGLAYGLKNAGGIAKQVVDDAEFSVNEQCVKYNECEQLQVFIKQDKPVLHIEYTAKNNPPSSFVQKSCDNQGAKGFSTLIKHLSLNAWTKTCPK